MEKCLKDNKVCSIQEQRCKKCKLDDCRRTIEMIEIQEEIENNSKRNLINKQLSEQCQNCSFLEVIDLDKQIVRCPYLVKNKCLIK